MSWSGWRSGAAWRSFFKVFQNWASQGILWKNLRQPAPLRHLLHNLSVQLREPLVCFMLLLHTRLDL